MCYVKSLRKTMAQVCCYKILLFHTRLITVCLSRTRKNPANTQIFQGVIHLELINTRTKPRIALKAEAVRWSEPITRLCQAFRLQAKHVFQQLVLNWPNWLVVNSRS